MTNLQFPRPTSGPEPVSPGEEKAFEKLVSGSLPAVRASAQSWRNGLTAMITLVTAGAVIKGRDTTDGLDWGWRLAITLTVGGSIVVAVIGLWLALQAEAGGRPQFQTLAQIHQKHASVSAYQVALAGMVGKKLSLARSMVGVAIGLLLLGIVFTWWAPEQASGPAAYLKVKTSTETFCGTLTSADGGRIMLTVEGHADPTVIPLTSVVNLSVEDTCS